MRVSLILAVAAAITGVSASYYEAVDGVYVPRVPYHAEDDTDLKNELRPLREDGKPLEKIDFHRLNLALYFESMKMTLFEEGLKKFGPEDWEAAGYDEVYHKLLSYMRDQEIGHAAAIQTILQGKGGHPCKYHFPFHDVKSFVDVCSQVTTVGEAGYLGFTWQLHNPKNRLTAYQIFATEARQNAKFRSAQGVNPLNSFFDTPLTASQAYTLANQFVEYCPPENPYIPFKLFPTLEVELAGYRTLKLKFDITKAVHACRPSDQTNSELRFHPRGQAVSNHHHYNLGYYGGSHDRPRSSHGHDGSSHGHDGSSHGHDGSSHGHDGSSHGHDGSSHGHDGSSHDRDGSSHDRDISRHDDHEDDSHKPSHKSSSSESGSDSDSNDEKKSHDRPGSGSEDDRDSNDEKKHHDRRGSESGSGESGSDSDSNDEKKHHDRRGSESGGGESGSDSDSKDEKKRHNRRGLSDDESEGKCCSGESRGKSIENCSDETNLKLYVAWINQIGVTYTDFNGKSGTTSIPPGQSGATFVAVTNSERCEYDCRFVADNSIVAGPVFLPAIPGDFLLSNA